MNAFLEDARLVELFWARDEAAIAESDAKKPVILLSPTGSVTAAESFKNRL